MPTFIKKRIITIFILLVLYNLGIWLIGLTFSIGKPFFFGLLAIAYGLGLRHAVDIDHIAAIDNTTRKFMFLGQKPISIGLYFSLGHSTIVILLSVAVAFASAIINTYLLALQSITFFIGTTVSGSFLLLIGLLNLIAFFHSIHSYRQANKKSKKHMPQSMPISGPLVKFFKPFFQTVSKTWHMYFVGLLFGLGFDTASEVALLSISAINGISHVSLFEIILIPFAFTAGMTLVDTTDGILMLFAYGWAYIKPERKLLYNLSITLLSILVAFVIGGIQLISIFTSH